MQIYKTIIKKGMKWQRLAEEEMFYHQAPSCNMGCC